MQQPMCPMFHHQVSAACATQTVFPIHNKKKQPDALSIAKSDGCSGMVGIPSYGLEF